MTKYLKNAGGTVHSVTDEHFASLWSKRDDETRLPDGFSEITEDEARQAAPELFGGTAVDRASVDPNLIGKKDKRVLDGRPTKPAGGDERDLDIHIPDIP